MNYLSKVAGSIKPFHWCVIIFLCVLFYSFLNNEILPLEYGNGFDEHSYVDIAKNFSVYLPQQNFNPYYNSRIIIPAIVHYLITIMNLDPNITTIRNLFLGFNLFSIVLSLIYFYKIVKFKNYNESTKILGFCFLFVNFFILKFSNYYPVLLDIFGFTSGIIIFYYYLSNKKIAFFISIFLSLFIFPTTILILIAVITSTMLVFSDKGLNIEKHLNKYRVLLVVGIVISMIPFIYKLIYPKFFPKSLTQFELNLVPLAIGLLLILIVYISKPLLLLFDKITFNRRFFSSPFFFIPVFSLLLFNLISQHLSLHFDGKVPLSPLKFIINLFYQALSFPLKFLISHFIYYGLFVSLFLIFHKQFFTHLKQSNSFYKIIAVVFILFSVGTETRQFIQLFPFFVFIFLDSIDKYKFNTRFLIAIFAFQLLWSRFWYNINTPEGFLRAYTDTQGRGQVNHFMEFPAQRYFQFQGPWLSANNSIIYGCIFVLTLLILFVPLKRIHNRGC